MSPRRGVLTGGTAFHPCLLALCLAAVVFRFLLAYDACWMHPELVHTYVPNALQTGPDLTLADFKRVFDFALFDQNGWPRPRFLSSLLLILNAKFRIWLFQRVVPHPSLSLTWIFTLVAGPLLLFQAVWRLTGKRTAAWIAVLLHTFSVGTLSGLTMLFHPAKPMTSFFVVSCLYLASRVRGSASRFALLLGVLFLGLFLDETALFALVAVPVLCPEVFASWRNPWLPRAAFASVFVLYLSCLGGFIPWLVSRLGYGTFDFGSVAFGSNAGLRDFRFSALGLNAFNLAREPFHLLGSGPWGLCLALPLLGVLAHRLRSLGAPEARIVKRGALALLAYVVFLSLLHTRHQPVITTSYYYGSLFPLLLAVPLSVLLDEGERPHLARKGALLCLLAVAGANFDRVNRSWIREHNRIHLRYLKSPAVIGDVDAALTYGFVKEVWARRADALFLEGARTWFPMHFYWLLLELEPHRAGRG